MSKIHISKSISICLSVSACCNLRFCNFQPRHPYNQYNRVSTFLEVARNGYSSREPCATRVDSVSHLDGDGGDVVPDGGREPGIGSIGQTLEGSFSAVSKRNFARKYAFESSRRDLHNALLCTALQSHFSLKNC